VGIETKVSCILSKCCTSKLPSQSYYFLCVCMCEHEFLLLLLCGYIVTFTKILTIDYSWIHLLHHFPFSPSPHSWSSFNRSYFPIYIHVYAIFPSCSPSYTLSFPPTGSNPPDRTALLSCSLVFLFIKRKEYGTSVCLR
jgi:hypothetical protein